jgi:polyisoprenoid-binding protein YceI
MRILSLFFLFLFLPTSFAAQIQPKGDVEFTAKGFPTFITIQGKGGNLTGSMEVEGNLVKKANFIVPLKDFKTGMDLRDEHMHEKYLESKKYPQAKLSLPDFKLEGEGKVKGTLNLHNKTHPIQVDYKTIEKNPLVVEAKFKLLLEDYGIDIPSFQGITVAKEIQVKVNLRQ